MPKDSTAETALEGPEAGADRTHRTQFSRTKQLMPQRHRLAEDLFTVAFIRSDKGLKTLRDMIDLYQQDTEVAFVQTWNKRSAPVQQNGDGR